MNDSVSRPEAGEPTRAQREACGQPRPEWVPEEAGGGFATWLLQGATPSGIAPTRTAPRRRVLGVEDYVRGIEERDTAMLARAITLVESQAASHQEIARELLARVMPRTGGALRIGITGIPGAGKSTFIEALGRRLCEAGRSLAVLAIDPSSTRTGGSVLGDKVRMEALAREPRAFIRPTPSGGTLGGVARKTREALLLCEAFGKEVVIVETVGVGQSEVTVRGMVDCFVVLMIPGAGDEVQGIKKGVMELADLLVVNKSEGENRPRAILAQAEARRVQRYLRPATEGWNTPVELVSALTGEGLDRLEQRMDEFRRHTQGTGAWAARRREQALAWMRQLIEEEWQARLWTEPGTRRREAEAAEAVVAGRIPPPEGARHVLAGLSEKFGYTSEEIVKKV